MILCILHLFTITTFNCFEYSLQENCLGRIIWHFWAEIILFFGVMLPAIVFYTLMCLTYSTLADHLM